MFNESNNLNIHQKPNETQDQFIERLKSEHRSIVSDLQGRLYQNYRHYKELQKEFENLPSGIVGVTKRELYSPKNIVKTYDVVEKVYRCSVDAMHLERATEDEKYSILQELLTQEVIKDKGLPIEVKIDTRLGIAVLRVNFCKVTDVPQNEPKIQYIN